MSPHHYLVALSVLVFPVLALPAESLPATPYSLREEEPPTGSNISRPTAKGSALPFNKRYNELTPEQQRLVKSQYEPMAEGDEPPFPANGLRNIYKAIADALPRLNGEGELSMFVEINSQGKATAVSVLKSPSAEMTQVVASVLMFEPYKPAVCSGAPCAMSFPFRIVLTKK